MSSLRAAMPGRKHAPMRSCTDASIEHAAVRIPVHALDFPGFRAWSRSDDFPEVGRIAFLGEEIYVDMSPERLDTHNAVKTEVMRVTANVNVEGDLGKIYSDRTRLVNEVAGLSNEPDGCFAKWESFESVRIRQVPSETQEGDYVELEGSPDWVMEIVSPASEKKDATVLKEKYHQAAIAEYWLIDARGDRVDFQILWNRRNGYDTCVRRAGWQKSRVFGRWFKLERRRDRIGQWQYRLRVKK